MNTSRQSRLQTGQTYNSWYYQVYCQEKKEEKEKQLYKGYVSMSNRFATVDSNQCNLFINPRVCTRLRVRSRTAREVTEPSHNTFNQRFL